MSVRSGGRSIVAAWLVAGLGCQRRETTTPPEETATHCNPADDCNDMFGGSTVRQHSDAAATVAELSHGCPYAPRDVPSLASLDDRSIPEFDASRSRSSNMHRGDEFLQDIDLHAHMMGIHGELFGCVDLAMCYRDGAELSGQGELEFDFELHPDGHVVAVSVEPSPGLDHRSVVACARRALARHRFPRYDGGQMMINYTVTIEAVADDG